MSLEYFKSLDEIKVKRYRDAARECLDLASRVIGVLEKYHPYAFGERHLFGRRDNEQAESDYYYEYGIELIYPVSYCTHRILPGTVYENMTADAVGFWFDVGQRDGRMQKLMHLYFLGHPDKSARHVAYYGFRLPTADEFARLSAMLDEHRAQRAREAQFQRILDEEK